MKNELKQFFMGTIVMVFFLAMLLSITALIKVAIKNKTYSIKSTIQNSQNINEFAFFNAFSMKNGVIFANSSNIFGNEQIIQTEKTVQKTYAKAKENCTFFRTENTNDLQVTNIWFTIPSTYFLQVFDEVQKNVISATYNNINGFVLKSTIDVVSFTPNQISLIDIFSQVGSNYTQLRNHATIDSNQITIMNPNDTFEYIATCHGTIPTGNNSNEWYYIKYSPSTDPTLTYFGYIYSLRATSLPSIKPNLEEEDLQTFAPIEYESASNAQIPTNLAKAFTLPTLIILTITISLPVIIAFAYLLTKRTRKFN